MALEERLGHSAYWEGQIASFPLTPWRSSVFRPRRTRRNLGVLLVGRFLSSLALAPIAFTAPCSTTSGMTFWMQTTGSIRQLLHHLLRQKSGKMILVEHLVAQSLRIERSSSFRMRGFGSDCRRPHLVLCLAIAAVKSSAMRALWLCLQCSRI